MPDNICNFKLNLGSFNANEPVRGSRKRQAAMDDALAELQRREHAQASRTATRSKAPSPSKAAPRKRSRKLKTPLPSTGKFDGHIYETQQTGSDVLELLQRAALEIEREDKNARTKLEQRDEGQYVTPQNPAPLAPDCAPTSGRNTPPLAYTTAISDLVQLSMAPNTQAGQATQARGVLSSPESERRSPDAQTQQTRPPMSAFYSVPAKDSLSANPSGRLEQCVRTLLSTPLSEVTPPVRTYLARECIAWIPQKLGVHQGTVAGQQRTYMYRWGTLASLR